MQTAISETESKSLVLSICVHHYTLRAPCPKGQEIRSRTSDLIRRGWGKQKSTVRDQPVLAVYC